MKDIYIGYLVPKGVTLDFSPDIMTITDSAELTKKKLSKIHYINYANETEYDEVVERYSVEEVGDEIPPFPKAIKFDGDILLYKNDTVISIADNTLLFENAIYREEENFLEFAYDPSFGVNRISFEGIIRVQEGESPEEFYKRKLAFIKEEFEKYKFRNSEIINEIIKKCYQ